MNPQPLVALAHANELRSDRANCRRSIRGLPRPESARRAVCLIEGNDPVLATLPVFKLLCWVKGVARHRAIRMLVAAKVGEMVPVGKLTDRQRRELGSQLEDCAARREAA